MEELVLFLMVACGLWLLAEVGGIMHRQYKQHEQEVQMFPAEWGPVGVGKQYPAAKQLGCGVCGVWTPKATCSECVTWAEIQSIDGEKHNALVHTNELIRRRRAAGW